MSKKLNLSIIFFLIIFDFSKTHPEKISISIPSSKAIYQAIYLTILFTYISIISIDFSSFSKYHFSISLKSGLFQLSHKTHDFLFSISSIVFKSIDSFFDK
ncbi:MAG: hypothetical protein P1U46_03445 [Patescibacteria group bacterium]|nr:hypothetical protein [Patescibacteria group bacterium]